MDLYALTFCGFAVTIFFLLSLGTYIRQYFIALTSDWAKLNDDLKSKFDEVQRSLDAIERRLKRQESGWEPPDY